MVLQASSSSSVGCAPRRRWLSPPRVLALWLSSALWLPAHLREQRPLADLISWFEMIDADGDGTLTLDEFFKWSISAASIVSGAGVVAIFKRYDADGSGRLDRSEV